MIDDVVAEMEAEQKKAAARSSAGSASWFMLKDGEKALIRCLLNLNAVAVILKHDFYNPVTRKFEVNALCAVTSGLSLEESQCKHCQTAKQTGNKKLLAQKYFVMPVWVYGVKNAQGQAVTYFDSEGNEQPVQGLKYLQMKATSDILATLIAMYRDGTDLTTLDLTISRTGAGTDMKYTTLPRQPQPFAVKDVPPQDRALIVQRIADLNPVELVDDDPGFPPAMTNGKAVPDF